MDLILPSDSLNFKPGGGCCHSKTAWHKAASLFLWFIQCPGTLSHFQKLMLRQELKHPEELQTCCDGQRWAGLSWEEKELPNKGTLVSPCPLPTPCLPCAWHLRMQPMRRGSQGAPWHLALCLWNARGLLRQPGHRAVTAQFQGWAAAEQWCWLLMGHPKHLPFTGIPTGLGCFSLLSHIIMCRNHPLRSRIQC